MHDESAPSRPLLDEPTTNMTPVIHDPHHREYAHILIPTGVTRGELPAVKLGLQLAAASRARLTLLHVIPAANVTPPDVEQPPSVHWLDAIDNLHQALSSERDTVARDRLQVLKESRRLLSAYVNREVPRHLRDQVEIRLECAIGDITDEIVRFAAVESADLVIMTSGLSQWWLPVVPTRVHRVLQQVRSRVIVVRPDLVDAKPRRESLRVAT